MDWRLGFFDELGLVGWVGIWWDGMKKLRVIGTVLRDLDRAWRITIFVGIRNLEWEVEGGKGSISHQSWLKTNCRVTMKLSVGFWMVWQLPVPYDGVFFGSLVDLEWNGRDCQYSCEENGGSCEMGLRRASIVFLNLKRNKYGMEKGDDVERRRASSRNYSEIC